MKPGAVHTDKCSCEPAALGRERWLHLREFAYLPLTAWIRRPSSVASERPDGSTPPGPALWDAPRRGLPVRKREAVEFHLDGRDQGGRGMLRPKVDANIKRPSTAREPQQTLLNPRPWLTLPTGVDAEVRQPRRPRVGLKMVVVAATVGRCPNQCTAGGQLPEAAEDAERKMRSWLPRCPRHGEELRDSFGRIDWPARLGNPRRAGANARRRKESRGVRAAARRDAHR